MKMRQKKNIVAAGCFPAGTKINTPTGYRLIEDMKVGDEVYAFSLASRFVGMPDEQPGQVFVKKITETFKHFVGVVGETTKLIKISYYGAPEHGIVHDDSLLVTGNHYILTPSKQSDETDPGFARADQLEVGDVMWTEYGDAVIITSIEDGGDYDFVYNFEVEDLHTYIAGGIRVHNGGGGKGGGKTPRQSPNSIQVKQLIHALFATSEGEIGGLWNDDMAQSIFFDGTPLKNSDGTYNFTNIGVDERTGLPDQTIIPGFSAVEAENLVGQELTNAVPITRTVSSANIDAVRITIEFTSGLQVIDAKSGDANGTEVSFQAQRRVQGGTWETVISPTVKQMSSGPFTVSGLLPRPAAAGVWEFRVLRTTPDHSANNIIDKTSLDSYTEIQDVKISYNNRALVAIAVGADSTNGKIPAVAFDIKGKLVKVPSNYNPETRVYTGAWNGQFSPTLQWTNNPAWVIYDLLQHERYGLASFGFDVNQVNVYSFYEAAKYCDELVPTAIGSGKFEPRFTFDAQLMVRESAWKTLSTIASTMNAKLYEHAGFLHIAQDRPTVPSRIINNSNVIDGLFVYSSSKAEETYTQVNVTFSDPTSNFLPTTVSEVASTADQIRHRYNKVDLAAYGATSQGQARRAAKWVLDTSLRQTELVDFAVGLENAAFEPNEVFYLLDKDYSQTTQEGRLLQISGNTLLLDRAIVISSGTWTISVYSADGKTIEERTITSTGTSATVTINSPITAGLGSVYIVSGIAKPRQFRLVSMTDSGNGMYNVQAVQHDPDKYARIEQGIIVPDEVYWQTPPLAVIDVPTNLVVQPNTAVNADGQIYRYLNISWTPPADGSAVSYQFQWRRNGLPLTVETLENPFTIVQSDFSGSYEFYVNAINSVGNASPTLTGTYEFNFEGANNEASDIPPVTGLELSGGGTTFSGSMNVVWNAPDTSGSKTQIKDYEVTIKTAGGTVLRGPTFTTATGFTYSYDDNVADGGPRSALLVTVRVRDTLNRFSTAVGQTFSSTGAAVITNLRVRGTTGTSFNTLDLDVTWNAQTNNIDWRADPNFAYFRVEVLNGSTVKRVVNVTDSAFTYSFNDNVKDNGQDTPSASIIIRVTAYSKLDVAGVSASATFTPAAPPVITSLFVKGTTGTIFNEADLGVTWVCVDGAGKNFSASNTFKNFKIEALNGTTVKRTNYEFSETYFYTIDQNIQDNTAPIRNPVLRVTATSVYNISSPSVSATFTNPAPAVPSNISITPGIGNYKVSYDAPAEFDVIGTYIWASTTSGFTPSAATLVADTSGYYASINSTPGTTYYVKVAAYDHFGKGAKNGSGLNVSAQSVVQAIAAGVPSQATAPTSGMVEGDTYVNTTDGKIYRYHNNAWTATVQNVDIAGLIANEQISSVASSKLTGQIADVQIAAISATKLTGTVTDAQIAGVNATKIAGQIVNNQIASVDTSKLNGQVTNAQIAGIDTTKLQGTITDAQIAAVAATKIAGQITNNQIAAVDASKLTGTIVNTQITSIDASKISGQVTNAQIAAVDASKLQGSVTNAQIAAVDASKLTGQISGVQIQDNAIFAPKIAAGAVVAGKIAANAVTADTIATGAITTGKLFVTGQGKAINADPGFQDVSAWNFNQGSTQFIANNETNTPYGPYVARSTNQSQFQSRYFPIEQNKRYKVTVWARKLAGSGLFYLRMYCMNKDNQQLAYQLTPSVEAIVLSPNWVRYTADIIPPIGTVWGAISIDSNNQGNGYSDFADARVEEFIGADLIVDGAIIAGKIAAGAVTAGTVAANAITADKIEANAVTAVKIAANAVEADKLAANSVTAGKVAAGAITAGTIAANAISADNIQGNAVTAGKLAAGAVTAGTIAAGAVQAGTVAAGAITGGSIQSNSITTTHLAIGDFENLFNVGTGTNISGLPASMSAQSDYAQFNSVWWNSIGESSPYTLELRNRDNAFGNVFPVKYGDEFYCSMLTVPFGNANSIYQVSVGMILFNAAGQTIAFPVGAVRQPGTNGAVKSEGVLTVDNGNATSAVLFFLINGPNDANFTAPGVGAHLGGIQVRRRNKGNLIVDGAITANKIGAGEVVAGKLGAGAVTAGTIAANAITAGTIDANAVTAANIQGGAVTAGKIAAGAVLAENIAAGAITTGKLYVSGQGKAINADPGYSDPTAWTKNGGDSLQFLFNGESNSPYGPYIARATNQVQYESNTFPIEQSKRYKVTTWARKQGGTSGTMYLRLQCFNKDGALTAFALVPSQEAVQLGTGWARYTGDIIPPVGTVRAKITIDANYQGNGYSDFADTRVEEFIGADLIVDGAIIANKLAAGSVTTDKLVAGAVIAEKIATNAVTTDKLDANSVTANKILASSVSTDKLAANAVTVDKLAANAVTADKIAAGAITANSAAIADAAINTLKLQNGSISDTRFNTANNSVTLTSGTGVGTYQIASAVVHELAITTPNPIGLSGPFASYIHAALVCNTRINGNIAVTSAQSGGISNGSTTISSNLSVVGTPSWQLRILNANGTLVASTDIVQNGSGVKTGNINVAIQQSGGISHGDTTLNSILNIQGGAGLNLLFLSPALAANTTYRIQLVVSGQMRVDANTQNTPVSITADNRAIYYQCLLR